MNASRALFGPSFLLPRRARSSANLTFPRARARVTPTRAPAGARRCRARTQRPWSTRTTSSIGAPPRGAGARHAGKQVQGVDEGRAGWRAQVLGARGMRVAAWQTDVRDQRLTDL